MDSWPRRGELSHRDEKSLQQTDLLCHDLQPQINDINVSLSSRCDQIESTIMSLGFEKDGKMKSIEALQQYLTNKNQVISKLQTGMDHLEQYSRRNSVRVFGVQESRNEITSDIVCDLAKKISVAISPTQILIGVIGWEGSLKEVLQSREQVLLNFAHIMLERNSSEIWKAGNKPKYSYQILRS